VSQSGKISAAVVPVALNPKNAFDSMASNYYRPTSCFLQNNYPEVLSWFPTNA
jgi:hypothetical protein